MAVAAVLLCLFDLTCINVGILDIDILPYAMHSLSCLFVEVPCPSTRSIYGADKLDWAPPSTRPYVLLSTLCRPDIIAQFHTRAAGLS
ncbi:hypothetical protein BV25DRAFT_1818147 [Artomyces pyxidatus]|uniref:Uncharacterized protein n=1 Tax=Artomyces pyxidatus TaxID=48021 RepID=A0ACB8TLA1_9AGAM|nr:hypothetical protein BV25DRAFT_1818147 [Artomyces pyxidatus]